MEPDVHPGLLKAIAWWLVSGAIVGYFFGIIMGTGKHGGFWGFVLVGIVGGFFGGLLYRLMGYRDPQGNIIAGFVGAVILDVLAQLSQRRPSKAHARR